ncbi:MAG: 4'-phosphopantetheinyl transferase superfamily protein [Planctomycetota bacterium]
MSTETELRSLVVELLEVPAERVTPAFSLRHKKLSGSLGGTLLRSAVKARLGAAPVGLEGASTFGELVAAVDGTAPSEAPRESFPSQGAGVVGAADMPGAVALPGVNPGAGVFPGGLRCGVDIESVEAMPACEDYWTHSFYLENFTSPEVAYCCGQAEPREHFAARWCAKEALRKCHPGYLALAMGRVEVARRPGGSVYLRVSPAEGVWSDAPAVLSLSHAGGMAVAMVVMSSPPEGGPPPPEMGAARGAALDSAAPTEPR